MTDLSGFKAAIVGMGIISPMHIFPLTSLGIEIAAVCDVCPTVSRDAGKQHGCAAFTNYEEMYRAGGFDTVHICLPHYLHAPASIAALEQGYHVLCEKPMATNLTDAQEMIDASVRTDRILCIVFQNRFNPGAVLIKQQLDLGSLGTLLSGKMRLAWNRGRDYYDMADWRGKLHTEGGGVAINQAIHSFDMLNNFLGVPSQVSAVSRNVAHPYIEVEDEVSGEITYDRAVVSFYVTTAHHSNDAVEISLECEFGRVVLLGEEATILFSDGRKMHAGPDLTAQARFGMKQYWGVSHIKQIQSFYTALLPGQNPVPDMYSSFLAQRVISAIYSCKDGEPVLV